MGLQCDTTCGEGTSMDVRLGQCVPSDVQCGTGTKLSLSRSSTTQSGSKNMLRTHQCERITEYPQCVYGSYNAKGGNFDLQCTVDNNTVTVQKNFRQMNDGVNRTTSQDSCDADAKKGDSCWKLVSDIIRQQQPG